MGGVTGRIYYSHFLSPCDTLGFYFVEPRSSDLKGPILTPSSDLFFELCAVLSPTSFLSTASGNNYWRPLPAKTDVLCLALTCWVCDRGLKHKGASARLRREV